MLTVDDNFKTEQLLLWCDLIIENSWFVFGTTNDVLLLISDSKILCEDVSVWLWKQTNRVNWF